MPEQVMLGIDGTLADLHKEGNWLYQPKFDGNRGKVIYENGKVQIINRRGGDWADNLPELAEAFLELAQTTGVKTFTFDGEIVVFKDGHSNLRLSNSRCATRDKRMIQLSLRRTTPVDFMAFDVMEWNGCRFEQEPFHFRVGMLSVLLAARSPKLRFTPTYTDADRCWEDWVVKRGEEGVMLKDMNSKYVYERSNAWIKVKMREKGVFNVCGYTQGEGRRGDLFGALILMDDNGQLKGRCGGGFTDAEAERILQVLKLAPVVSPPFSESEVGLPYIPIKTPMKVEVAYQNMNYDSGKLRSPQLIRWWLP